MQPRHDPETRPAAMSVQIERRPRYDEYGRERPGNGIKKPVAARNGLSLRPYRYRGTGDCMSEKEARFWLERR